MGSPISPLFADIVMDYLENYCSSVLKRDFDCIPLFYYRYVDDTILCVHKEYNDTIINTFNSYDLNLQFIFELEKYKRIHFMNITLNKNSNMIITNCFHKQTSFVRIINYFSNHPT